MDNDTIEALFFMIYQNTIRINCICNKLFTKKEKIKIDKFIEKEYKKYNKNLFEKKIEEVEENENI